MGHYNDEIGISSQQNVIVSRRNKLGSAFGESSEFGPMRLCEAGPHLGSSQGTVQISVELADGPHKGELTYRRGNRWFAWVSIPAA